MENQLGKSLIKIAKKRGRSIIAPVLEPEQKLEVWQETGQRFWACFLMPPCLALQVRTPCWDGRETVLIVPSRRLRLIK
jgi:hypothetical protein